MEVCEQVNILKGDMLVWVRAGNKPWHGFICSVGEDVLVKWYKDGRLKSSDFVKKDRLTDLIQVKNYDYYPRRRK